MTQLRLKVTNNTATLTLHTGWKSSKDGKEGKIAKQGEGDTEGKSISIGLPLLPAYPAKDLAAYAKELAEVLDCPLTAVKVVSTTTTSEETFNV